MNVDVTNSSIPEKTTLELINSLKHLEEAQLFLLKCGYQHPGEDFFQSLARYLAESLQMDYICIDKLSGDNLSARTLAVYFDGKFEDNVRYTLKETPCGAVVGKHICVFPNNVRNLFPEDIVLQDMKAESYFGVTLWGHNGSPIGLIAMINRQPVNDVELIQSVLKMVAIRAAGELERKDQEDLLKKRESLLIEMGRIAQIGIWEFDVITLNQIWTEEVYKIHELPYTHKPNVSDGIGFYDIDDRPIIEAAIRDAVTMGKPFDLELKFITSKGNKRWVHSIGKAIFEDGVISQIRGTIQDITDRKLASEAIQAQGNQLRIMNEEKDKLFSILAHDLRSPFNTFLGFTQLMADELDDLTSEDIKMMASGMRKSALNLFNLLEDLLEWSRLQRGILKFNPVSFIVTEKLSESIEQIRETASLKGVGLIMDVPADFKIFADVHMFRSIVRNLISNAVKFTPRGGKVLFSLANHDSGITEFMVTDNGIGIPKSLLDKLFRLTDQENRKGTDGEPGTGLGLVLCHEFITRHGGNIYIHSEVGKGTTVSFSLNNELKVVNNHLN